MKRVLNTLCAATLMLAVAMAVLYLLPLSHGRPLLTFHLLHSTLPAPSQPAHPALSPPPGDPDSAGPGLDNLPPGTRLLDPAAYELTCLVSVENQGPQPLLDLGVRVPLPSSLGRWQLARNLQLSPDPERVITSQDGFTEAYYRRARLAPGERLEIKVSAQVQVFKLMSLVDFTTLKPAARAELPRTMQPWLAPEAGVECDTPTIGALARLVSAGQGGNAYLELLADFDYVCRKVGFDASLPPLGALGALKRGQAQCADAIHLLMALGRWGKIPARFVGGLYLGNFHDLRTRPVTLSDTHAWGWFYLPGSGWIPIDPTLGRFDETSRYDCFGGQRNTYLSLWADHQNFLRVMARPGAAEGMKVGANYSLRVRQIDPWVAAPDKPQALLVPGKPAPGKNWMSQAATAAPAQAVRALQAGRLGEAWSALVKAEASGIPSPAQRLLEGKLLLAARQIPQAYALFQNYMALRPQDPEGYRGMLVLLHRLDDPGALLAGALQATQRFPAQADFLAERGYARLLTGDPARAEADLRQALVLEPKNGRYYALLGRIQAGRGQVPAAVQSLRQGLALGVPPGEAVYYRRMLEMMEQGR